MLVNFGMLQIFLCSPYFPLVDVMHGAVG